MLRAGPPSKTRGSSSVVAGLAFIFAMIPLCSYAKAGGLHGAAVASHMRSTAGTACLVAASSVCWLCRPAVLLSNWTVVAEPEHLRVASYLILSGKCPCSALRSH